MPRQAGADREEIAKAANARRGAYAESSVAEELPGHAGTGHGEWGRRAVFGGVRLRSALNARLRLAGLRSGRRHRKPYGAKNIRKGTLLLHQDRGHF